MKTTVTKESVRSLVSKATGVNFEVIRSTAESPLPVKNSEWFMRCRTRDDIEKTPYLNIVWKEVDGPIWLESLALGDTFNWIATAYGEEAAGESIDANYTEFGKDARAEFAKKYPLVDQRIKDSELIAEQFSRKYKVNLGLRSEGSKGIVVFTLAGSVPVDRSWMKHLEAVILALKEAYDASKLM